MQRAMQRMTVGLTILMLSLAVSTRLQGQSVSAPTQSKDAGVATILGLVFPGGGQFYTEETGRGFAYAAFAVGAVVVGTHYSHGDIYGQQLVTVPVTIANPLGLEFRPYLAQHANYSPAMIGGAVAVGAWLWAAVDAPASARRANEKRSHVSLIASPSRIGVSVGF